MLAPLHRLSSRWLPLALFVPATFVAAPAHAAPYSLCASLLNSSHPGTRTLESGCAGLDPHTDPTAVSVELTTEDFGSFAGLASASSDAFDVVRLFVSVALTDYRAGSYIEEVPGQGIPFAGSAFATYRDALTVTGPSQLATLQATFGVSGMLEWNGIAGQLCYGFAFGGPISGGPCLTTQDLPPQITLTSQLFPVNSTQELNFMFEAVVFVADANFSDPYTASATADLAHTITLQELLILGADSQPIRGVTIDSEAGFAYPLSPRNQAPVPEPGTAALLLSGGVLFAAVRRRRSR